MSYETYISHRQESAERIGDVSPLTAPSINSESDYRWLHSRLSVSDNLDNSSIASSQRVCDQMHDHVGRNVENIGKSPVRTVVKDLSMSMNSIELRFCVRDAIDCAAIGKTLQDKFMATGAPQPTATAASIPEASTSPTRKKKSLHNDETSVRHSGELISRCGDCNGSAIIARILKR